MTEISLSLVINWDQTGIQYLPVSQWTMDREGMKLIENTIVKINAYYNCICAVTMDGNILPPQLFDVGKTP